MDDIFYRAGIPYASAKDDNARAAICELVEVLIPLYASAIGMGAPFIPLLTRLEALKKAFA